MFTEATFSIPTTAHILGGAVIARRPRARRDRLRSARVRLPEPARLRRLRRAGEWSAPTEPDDHRADRTGDGEHPNEYARSCRAGDHLDPALNDALEAHDGCSSRSTAVMLIDDAVNRDDASSDLLTGFLRAIGRRPLLTTAQEVELAERIERGDLDAKRELIESNLRQLVDSEGDPVRARRQGADDPTPQPPRRPAGAGDACRARPDPVSSPRAAATRDRRRAAMRGRGGRSTPCGRTAARLTADADRRRRGFDPG